MTIEKIFIPMIKLSKNSPLYAYLSFGQRGLITEGLFLISDLKKHPKKEISDYSYLVFPFAKAYEGFLKQLFLDCHFIKENEYSGDHFRIGRALNPHLEKSLRGESVYDAVVGMSGNCELADRMWAIWRRGRNLVFHYFPHNFKALTLPEAEMIIEEIVEIMKECERKLKKNNL